jgi:hypothetical protein
MLNAIHTALYILNNLTLTSRAEGRAETQIRELLYPADVADIERNWYVRV